MTRSYALTFAGVTLRVWLVVLVLALQPLRDGYFHSDGDQLMTQAYLVTPWLSWVPDLIVAEHLVARLRDRGLDPGQPLRSTTGPPLQPAGH